MFDYIIRYIWFPSRVKALTTIDEDGRYNIYVNESLCFNQQQITIRHELEHIKNGDFDSYCDVAELEKRINDLMG